MRLFTLQLCLYFVVLVSCLNRPTYAANDYGADYAFLFLMTLTPDFAAANYTIHNADSADVDTSILRLPFKIDMMKKPGSRLRMEVVPAYQRTSQVIQTFPSPGENIDSEWDTYGAGLGFLYEYDITERLSFTPGVHVGLAMMENHAKYNGALTNLFKDQFEGTLVNWTTNASVLDLGLGLSYHWKLMDRASSVKAEVYRVMVDTFDESNAAVSFTEVANMATIKADMIFPTGYDMHGRRMDMVALLGANNFFGENSDTLGYTTSYQAGIGVEFPINSGHENVDHFRLSGQVIRASNMKGWLLSLGYNTD